MSKRNEDRLDHIEAQLEEVLASFNVVFQEPDEKGRAAHDPVHQAFIAAYASLLAAMRAELPALREAPGLAQRYYRVTGAEPDSVDYLNQLGKLARGRSLAEALRESVWWAGWDQIPPALRRGETPSSPGASHLFHHVKRLLKLAVEVPRAYTEWLAQLAGETGSDTLPRLAPLDFGSLEEDIGALPMSEGQVTAETLEYVRVRIEAQDQFAAAEAFRVHGRQLSPVDISDIRRLRHFYGYKTERAFFNRHFQAFAEGKKVQPLLLSGLPGLGKTHLTIAFAEAFPGLVLVMAEERALQEQLEWIVGLLGEHNYRRFVLFFDDIDPENVDWSVFRRQVDGYLPYPDNVAMVISSNFEFADRIRSRSAVYEFRPMSPEVCNEIILDYLNKHRGIRPQENKLAVSLTQVIAADYINQLRLGRISELTPRSLVRYFRQLDEDVGKMRSLMRAATMPIHPVPDEEWFRDHNSRLRERIEEDRGLEISPDETVST